MKKCIFCAEEIQDEAKVCRFCKKTVTGFWIRRMIKIIMLGSIIAFIWMKREVICDTRRDLETFRDGASSMWTSVQESIVDVSEGVSVMAKKLKSLGDAEIGNGSDMETMMKEIKKLQ